jgi:hypothetical protein
MTGGHCPSQKNKKPGEKIPPGFPKNIELKY